MSSHRLYNDLALSATIDDPGSAGTIFTDRSLSVVNLVTGTGETRTLADPDYNGQILTLNMMTDAGDAVVTTSTAYDENGSTAITFANEGEFVKFISIPDPATSGSFVWRVTSYDGVMLPGNVVAQSGTTAEDLSATAKNLVWYSEAAQAGDITLPQATAVNAGMVITIIAGANWATATAFKLGFLESGSTVLIGTLRVSALDAVLTTSFAVTTNAKVLALDADEVTKAGGAKGSTYVFTYLAANLVHVSADAYITTGTVATAAAASITTGIS
jgi:hypothetical protein